MKLPIIITCLLAQGMFAQGSQTVSKELRNETVSEVANALREQYVFADVAGQMAAYVEKNNKSGKYNKLSEEELAARLTSDLQSISKDGHVRVIYSKEVLPPSDGNKVKMYIPEEEKAGHALMLKHTNYGIAKLEVLPGNIGYIDFTFFCDPEFAGDTYAAAMNYVAHTDALIVDLRHCGGSFSPDAVPFISSYLFDKPTHLNTIYWRESRQPLETWTKTDVPGKRYIDKPVYILTSGSTFSGAEAMAYDLQVLKRVTIVGSVTGGGANAGGIVRITDHYSMFIPVGRAKNPITQTNWEGTGVHPDASVNSRFALQKAQELALKQMLTNKNDMYWEPELKRLLSENLQNQPKTRKITFELAGYNNAKEVYVAGSHNDWSSKIDRMEYSDGKWTLTVDAGEGKLNYKFVVDGVWIRDPANPNTEGEGEMANSVLY